MKMFIITSESECNMFEKINLLVSVDDHPYESSTLIITREFDDEHIYSFSEDPECKGKRDIVVQAIRQAAVEFWEQESKDIYTLPNVNFLLNNMMLYVKVNSELIKDVETFKSLIKGDAFARYELEDSIKELLLCSFRSKDLKETVTKLLKSNSNVSFNGISDSYDINIDEIDTSLVEPPFTSLDMLDLLEEPPLPESSPKDFLEPDTYEFNIDIDGRNIPVSIFFQLASCEQPIGAASHKITIYNGTARRVFTDIYKDNLREYFIFCIRHALPFNDVTSYCYNIEQLYEHLTINISFIEPKNYTLTIEKIPSLLLLKDMLQSSCFLYLSKYQNEAEEVAYLKSIEDPIDERFKNRYGVSFSDYGKMIKNILDSHFDISTIKTIDESEPSIKYTFSTYDKFELNGVFEITIKRFNLIISREIELKGYPHDLSELCTTLNSHFPKSTKFKFVSDSEGKLYLQRRINIKSVLLHRTFLVSAIKDMNRFLNTNTRDIESTYFDFIFNNN